MGSLGSQKETKETIRTYTPAFQQTNTLLANNDGMAPQSDQPQRKFLPRGGANTLKQSPNRIQNSPKPFHKTSPKTNKPSAQPVH